MKTLERILGIENRTELIDKCVEYMVNEYVRAGGRIEDTNTEAIMWGLEGIYERDGKSGVKEFMQNWKPYIPAKRVVGYA